MRAQSWPGILEAAAGVKAPWIGLLKAAGLPPRTPLAAVLTSLIAITLQLNKMLELNQGTRVLTASIH